MEGKLEVNRLGKEELAYELAFRGVSGEATVREMRRQLRGFLRLERAGTSVKYPKYPFKFTEDFQFVEDKMAELTDLVKNFSDFDSSPDFSKISSKLIHVFKRTERSVASDEEENNKRSQMLVALLNLQSTLASRARKTKRASLRGTVPVGLSALSLSSPESESSDSEVPDHCEFSAPSGSSPKVTTHSSDPISQGKCVPVSKWNLTKFDGDNKKLSLSAFLENVEELCISRNVAEDVLFQSASDLFSGKALIWFRSVRSGISDWSELVRELRLQFQPPNFNEKLLDEIKTRTQGPDESMGMYLAIMANMFNRLTVTVSEPVRLRILLRNIHPFYQGQLGLVEIKTINQLLDFGRKMEARKESIEGYKPPPRSRSALMEPDLAYVYSSGDSVLTHDVVGASEVSVRCWRCREVGQRANVCEAPSTSKYCFRCGNPNHTVRSCPKCNTASGNANRRS